MQKSNKIFKRYYTLLYIVPILTLLFISHNTFALDYSSNTNVQFTFNPTLSVSVSDNLIIDELMPGTYSDSNIVDVSVSTNNVAGYSLSATVGTNSTNNRLVHSSDSNTYFSSLSSNISDLSSFSDNTWGYSYSTDSGSTWISGNTGSTSAGYNGLPQDANTNASERGKNGITLISTTTPVDNQTIKFKIGAKAGNNQAAGTYTNTINFYAITKIPPISISDAFAAAGKSQYNGYYKMQDMDTSICNAVQTIGEDSTTDLIDVRDGEVYKIAKLKDNNCWLLDNLRLDPTDSNTASNMNENNTNASSTAIANYLNGSTTALQSGWSTAKVVNTATNSWPNTYTNPQVNTAFGNNTKDTIVNNHYGNGSGKRGVYYNYCAATVGTYCYEGGQGADLPDTIIDAPYDVCSIGWRMPTGGVRKNDTEQIDSGMVGEYQTLCTILNNETYCRNGTNMDATSDNSLQYQLSLLLTGYLRDGSQGSFNSIGAWWSSTYYSGPNNMYNLATYSSQVFPMDRNARYNGFTMRCIARSKANSINDLRYMQDFNNLTTDELTAVKNSMPSNQQYTLQDKRDGNSYTIKKINGEVWMTQNLRYLGDSGSPSGTMTIGNNNSNVENKSITLYSLNSSNAGNFNPYSGHCDDTNGYNYACVYDSGNATTGVWYNYATATAGTITGSSNYNNATSDICPAGWHLPSGPNTIEGTDFNKLVGNTTSGWQNPTAELTAFDAAADGLYSGGSIIDPERGYWWSATARNVADRYDLIYNGDTNQFDGGYRHRRYFGFFARCVMSN